MSIAERLPSGVETNDSIIWQAYYGRETIGFRDHCFAYESAASVLKARSPEIFSFETKPTFVLAGFHPNCGTPEAFKGFCRFVCPNCKLVLVDQNATPFRLLRNRESFDLCQAKLEDWVYGQHPCSIDGIFFDCTTGFMNDRQIKRMAAGLSNCLNDKGLAWVLAYEPVFGPADDLLKTLLAGVRCRLRKGETILKLFSPWLKPVYIGRFEVVQSFSKDPAYLMVLVKEESSLKQTDRLHLLPINP